MSGRTRREGYALLGVLWLSLGIGGLGLIIAERAREAAAAARHRIALAQAGWAAAGCLAQAREKLARALASEAALGTRAGTAWDRAAELLVERIDVCQIDAWPMGSRLDVNSADPRMLGRLFRGVGIDSALADSAAAAVVSRRPFLDLRQLRSIPGLERPGTLDSLLGIDTGPISLRHAPRPLLALLPGFTEHTVRRVLEDRARGVHITSFHDLSPLLAPDDTLAAARLPGVAVLEPMAWTVTVRGSAGAPPVSVVQETRLVRSGTLPAVARHRTWIE